MDAQPFFFYANMHVHTRRLLALILIFSSAAGLAADKCHDLYRLTDLSWAVEPGFIVEATDSAPEHCRLRGVVNRAIRVEVRLPTEGWNGRMMFSTVGGSAGVIGDTVSLLGRGFVPETRRLRRVLEVPEDAKASLFFEQYDTTPVIPVDDEEVMTRLKSELRAALGG